MRSDQCTGYSARASVEITEFGDLTCPQSRQVRKLIDEAVGLFKERVAHRYRHYPDLDNNESMLASVALEAANRQGQFWPMYAGLLNITVIQPDTLLNQAIRLGLDQRQYMNDLLSDQVHDVIKADWQSGYSLDVRHAPALFVNGYRFHGKLTLSRLVPFIKYYVSQENKGTPSLRGTETGLYARIKQSH